jgi:hypothetical protein
MWLAGLLVPAIIMLSGCEFPDDDSGDSVGEAGVGQPGTTTAGCHRAGPGTGHWLPVLDTSDEHQANISTRENPCLPFSDLIGLINDVIPESKVPEYAVDHVSTFRRAAQGAVDKFLAVEDGVECGYETDSLAIVVYQHSDEPWSVGLVVVVRLSLDAAIDVAGCYLEKQLGFDAPPNPVSINQIEPEFCGLAGQPDDYAVVALGTSNWMCEALETSPAGLNRVL